MMDLEDIRWDRYSAVAEHAMARRWIENQVLLGMAPSGVVEADLVPLATGRQGQTLPGVAQGEAIPPATITYAANLLTTPLSLLA